MGKAVDGGVYGIEPGAAAAGPHEKIEISGNMAPKQWAGFKNELQTLISKYPNLTHTTKPIPHK